MAKLNLLDIAKLNGTDRVVGLIEENLTYAPEVATFPARTIRGTSFPTVKRTGFPTVGFRKANAGITPGKSTFARQLTELYILAGAVEIDQAVADATEDGAAYAQTIEASGFFKSALMKLGSQIWYGTDSEVDGFPGIKAITPKSGLTSVNATGTTATTASSVYAVKFGPQDAEIVLGLNATFELGKFRVEQIRDANDSTKRLPAYVADLSTWVGLSVQNVNCVGRILNVTADSGKGLSDGLLAELIGLFPVNYKPDALFMSRRSRLQLQKSRTVTLAGMGKTRPNQPNIAPVPTEYDGIPIIATDSILNTDAIE